MPEIERNRVDLYIDSLVDLGCTFDEIESKVLKKSDLTITELRSVLKEIFTSRFKEAGKKCVKASIILFLISILFVFLYYYFTKEQETYIQQQIASDNASNIGGNKYLVFGKFDNHDFLMNIGIWSGIDAVISLVFFGINYLKINRIRKI